MSVPTYEQFETEVREAMKKWGKELHARRLPKIEIEALKEEADNLIIAWKEFYPRRRQKIEDTKSRILAEIFE